MAALLWLRRELHNKSIDPEWFFSMADYDGRGSISFTKFRKKVT